MCRQIRMVRSKLIHWICLSILFSFFLLQACTGIDNIAEAITLLELNNWDLVVSSLSAGFALCSLTDRPHPARLQLSSRGQLTSNKAHSV